MILGVGVDMEEVERLKAAIERHGRRFLERVFTAGEIAHVDRAANRIERYAVRFAAKEAGMKAIGTGWAGGVRWSDFEIVNSESGRPEMKLSGRAAEIATSMGCRAVHVSLSHTKRMAIAQVVLDG